MEGQVPGSIKKERSREVTELFERTALQKNRAWIGWEGKVVIDQKCNNDAFQGRNFAYKPVIVRGNYNLGDEVYAKILYATTYDLRAKILGEPAEIKVGDVSNGQA